MQQVAKVRDGEQSGSGNHNILNFDVRVEIKSLEEGASWNEVTLTQMRRSCSLY